MDRGISYGYGQAPSHIRLPSRTVQSPIRGFRSNMVSTQARRAIENKDIGPGDLAVGGRHPVVHRDSSRLVGFAALACWRCIHAPIRDRLQMNVPAPAPHARNLQGQFLLPSTESSPHRAMGRAQRDGKYRLGLAGDGRRAKDPWPRESMPGKERGQGGGRALRNGSAM